LLLPGQKRRDTAYVSVVVPVYQGERTLGALVEEIEPLTHPQTSPAGNSFRVAEVLLVHDGARDQSGETMRSLAARHPFVNLVWLSRNYGQHAATIAGMAGTSSDWVVTFDEDGQHDPGELGKMLDVAIATGAQIVYAMPTNAPPHGRLRNAASAATKWTLRHVLGNRQVGRFSSFRLVQGEIARGLAAYCGTGVFLDVAFSWVVGRVAHCPVVLRRERGRPSGYSLPRLVGHFWQLVLTSGTRPLRLISLLGAIFALGGVGISAFVIWRKLTAQIPVAGWTSLAVIISISSGLILLSLGVIAEYLGIAVSSSMGRPLYLIISDPDRPFERQAEHVPPYRDRSPPTDDART
jgi:polyisoprenyl-phosphate glycosyltransferase